VDTGIANLLSIYSGLGWVGQYRVRGEVFLDVRSKKVLDIENLANDKNRNRSPNPVPPHIPRQFAVQKKTQKYIRKNYSNSFWLFCFYTSIGRVGGKAFFLFWNFVF